MVAFIDEEQNNSVVTLVPLWYLWGDVLNTLIQSTAEYLAHSTV